MNLRKSMLFALMLIGAMILVACGGGDGGDTDDGGDGGSVNLSQTVEAEDGASMSYPEGWVAEAGPGAFLFASSQELLDMAMQGGEPESINSGDAFVSVSFLPSEGMMPEGTSLTDILDMFASEGLNTSGEATELTIGGQEAASISGTSTDGVESGGYLLVVNDAERGNLIVAVALTASGEEASLGDTVNAMVESFSPAGGE